MKRSGIGQKQRIKEEGHREGGLSERTSCLDNHMKDERQRLVTNRGSTALTADKELIEAKVLTTAVQCVNSDNSRPLTGNPPLGSRDIHRFEGVADNIR